VILDTAGNWYGTTSAGGAINYGLVFQLALNNGTWMENGLHEFNGKYGSVPGAGVILDGKETCTARLSPAVLAFPAPVFQLIPNNGKWTAKVLHNFGNGTATASRRETYCTASAMATTGLFHPAVLIRDTAGTSTARPRTVALTAAGPFSRSHHN
jgi:hypothetical protein